jgi:hypothetical protein
MNCIYFTASASLTGFEQRRVFNWGNGRTLTKVEKVIGNEHTWISSILLDVILRGVVAGMFILFSETSFIA